VLVRVQALGLYAHDIRLRQQRRRGGGRGRPPGGPAGQAPVLCRPVPGP